MKIGVPFDLDTRSCQMKSFAKILVFSLEKNSQTLGEILEHWEI